MPHKSIDTTKVVKKPSAARWWASGRRYRALGLAVAGAALLAGYSPASTSPASGSAAWFDAEWPIPAKIWVDTLYLGQLLRAKCHVNVLSVTSLPVSPDITVRLRGDSSAQRCATELIVSAKRR